MSHSRYADLHGRLVSSMGIKVSKSERKHDIQLHPRRTTKQLTAASAWN